MANVWEFLIKERGLTEATLKSFGVKALDDGGVQFTFPGGIKSRWHDDEGKRHFKTEKTGLEVGLFGHRDPDAEVAFLVEGETDALRLLQELGNSDSVATVLGMAGINAWRNEYADEFKAVETVFVVLDNDPDYKVAATVDKTWRQIRGALGKKARRIYLPAEVKDLCEFFDRYNLDALRMLADRPNGVWHYDALDLTKEPSEPDWLVSQLICRGDLAMMIGEPGVGKSWLSMALAVAIAEGSSTWLGHSLMRSGRVLYVDEENPEGLVAYRLRKLGLSDSGAEQIRYLHRQGVRLDRYPEKILDEALEWEPELIVLDSLTRIHTKDENNAGEIAGLFNDGIVPLARESGATTLILHHVNKTDSNSSFTRARGSGDLSASIDSGLDVRASDTGGGIYVSQYKSRWIQEGEVIRAQIMDAPDGSVNIAIAKPAF